MASQVSGLLPFFFVDKFSNTRVQLPISRKATYKQFMRSLYDVSTPVAAQIKNSPFSWTGPSTTRQPLQRFTVDDGPWLSRTVTVAQREDQEYIWQSQWQIVSRKSYSQLLEYSSSWKSDTSLEILHTLQHRRDEEAARRMVQQPIWVSKMNPTAQAFTPATMSGPSSFSTPYSAPNPEVPYQTWQAHQTSAANIRPAGISAPPQYEAPCGYRHPGNPSSGPPPSSGPVLPRHQPPYQPHGYPMAYYSPAPSSIQNLVGYTPPPHALSQIPPRRPGQRSIILPDPYTAPFPAPSRAPVPAVAPPHFRMPLATAPIPNSAPIQAPVPASPRAPTLRRASTPADLSPWDSDMYPRLIVDSADIHWIHREEMLQGTVQFGKAPVVEAMDVWTQKAKPRY